MDTWFTADTHFNHDLIRKYCHRPFDTCQEMDEIMIANWNNKIKPGDIVYHLGDFAFGKEDAVKKYRNRLMGKIHLILGNHDYKNKIHRLTNIFSSVRDLLEIKYNHQRLILCHYNMRTWNASHFNSYQLHGHSHGTLAPTGKQLDVGVDVNNFSPVHIDQIMKIMLMKPDNFNYISQEEREREKDE